MLKMCDKKRYDLLSIDNDCDLEKININISNPDLTSIISALENNKETTNLFFKNNDENYSIIHDKLDYFLNQLDNIKLWLHQTLIPSIQLMDLNDKKNIFIKLNFVDGKLHQLQRMSKNIVSNNRSKKQNYTFPYLMSCSTCAKYFSVYGRESLLQYEAHEHFIPILRDGILSKKIETKNNDDEKNDSASVSAVSPKSSSPRIKNPKVAVPSKSLSQNGSQMSNTTLNLKSKIPQLYSGQVQNVLYPSELTAKISTTECNESFYSIQYVAPSRWICIICKLPLHERRTLFGHVSGRKHQKLLHDEKIRKQILSYHETFSKLAPSFQKHQVIFYASFKIGFVQCKTCSTPVACDEITSHILTERHKIKFFAATKFLKYYFYRDIAKFLSPDFSDVSEEESITSQIIYNSAESSKMYAKESKESNNSDDENSSETSYRSRSKDNPVEGTSTMSDESKNLSQSDAAQVNGKKPDKKGHYIIPSLKENPKYMFDFLENRFQVHVEYLEYFNDDCICTLCDGNAGRSAESVRNHFISSDHKKNAQVHLGKLKYVHYCDLCYKYITNEAKWFDHLQCVEHQQRLNVITKSGKQPRGGKFLEYECTTCCLILYGNKSTIHKHLNEDVLNKKTQKRSKEVKLPLQLINLLKNETEFNEEIYKLNRESNEVLKSIGLSWQCCESIEEALQPIFGQCKAYPFGSRVSGLGNLVSDLDVFVDMGYMYDGMVYQDPENQARFVKQTAKALKKHKNFVDVFPIPSARTPIVQVFHKLTGLDCDLSFRHGLSVENTAYLKLCIDVQPQLKSLILFLKRWSFMCKMNDRISTYALSMLSIFFFQINNYLPSVKTLRELDPTEPKTIGGWKTYHYGFPASELKNHVTSCNIFTRDLLCRFFEYYSKFKFNIEVVCPLLGHTVLKADFYEDKGKRLPPEMSVYVAKINESEENEVFRSLSPMCIQDPFDLSHNLTKACPVEVVNRFVTLCRLSQAALWKKALK